MGEYLLEYEEIDNIRCKECQYLDIIIVEPFSAKYRFFVCRYNPSFLKVNPEEDWCGQWAEVERERYYYNEIYGDK